MSNFENYCPSRYKNWPYFDQKPTQIVQCNHYFKRLLFKMTWCLPDFRKVWQGLNWSWLIKAFPVKNSALEKFQQKTGFSGKITISTLWHSKKKENYFGFWNRLANKPWVSPLFLLKKGNLKWGFLISLAPASKVSCNNSRSLALPC